MHASETGAALALQPEDEGEKTALSRLRAIYRRATQYSLPGPYWATPDEFLDLDATGNDALVFRDGAASADEADEKTPVAVRADDSITPDASNIRFDPPWIGMVEGTA